ncbi:MAG: hypothetical protein FE039_00005, partial [Thermoplasmata archaeon]
MKANRKFKMDNHAVSSVLGTALMLPIVMMILSAMMLWADDLINKMKAFQDHLQDMADEISDLKINLTTNGEDNSIIWEDDFEGGALQWYRVIDPPGSGYVKCNFSENTDYYYSNIKSAKIATGSNSGDKAGIRKPFPWSPLEIASIEIRFTISANDSFKYFRIYQNGPSGEKNRADIRIDLSGEKIEYLDGRNSTSETDYQDLEPTGVLLLADDYCWHTMKIILDFDSDATGIPHYKDFILDGITYHGAYGADLFNAQPGYRGNSIYVEYISES